MRWSIVIGVISIACIAVASVRAAEAEAEANAMAEMEIRVGAGVEMEVASLSGVYGLKSHPKPGTKEYNLALV